MENTKTLMTKIFATLYFIIFALGLSTIFIKPSFAQPTLTQINNGFFGKMYVDYRGKRVAELDPYSVKLANIDLSYPVGFTYDKTLLGEGYSIESAVIVNLGRVFLNKEVILYKNWTFNSPSNVYYYRAVCYLVDDANEAKNIIYRNYNMMAYWYRPGWDLASVSPLIFTVQGASIPEKTMYIETYIAYGDIYERLTEFGKKCMDLAANVPYPK